MSASSHSQHSQLSSGGARSAGSDTAKLSQLFDKINSANNLEIEERSIKNIAQKTQLNLVASQDLAVNCATQIGYLMSWINKRYQQATNVALNNAFQVLAFVSQCDEGRNVLESLGAQPFLNSVYQDCKDELQKDAISRIMTNLVNPPLNETNHGASVSVSNFGEPMISSAQKSHLKSVAVDLESNMNTPAGLVEHTPKQRGIPVPHLQADFTVRPNHQASMSSHSHQQSQHSQSQAASNGISTQQTQLHSAHMELLHKNQCLKEVCELPFVHLSEHDEKLIFDLGVQLKFGDFRTVLNTCQCVDLILQDFPVEVLLQRTDVIKALLDLLEGGASGQQAFSNLAQKQLIQVCIRLRQLYKFNLNNMTKKSQGECPQEYEYLQNSYPPCKDGVWNTLEAVTDLKKYGAQMPTEKMAAAALQGSLSCKAVLGLILTKSVYLLKDTEKIGLYLQLIKEAWRTVLEIYQTEGNPEFTELMHLVLFAFDQVCEFYRDQIYHEPLIAPVLDQALIFLRQLNSIPQMTGSPSDKYKNPFSETFFKNTEKLQSTLRRGLFTMSLSAPKCETILQFFERMESDLPQVNLLQKQVTAQYERALDAHNKFIRVHNYRLSQEGKNFEDLCFVDNVSQLNSAIEVLETLTGCIEMKVAFPFEHLMLDCVVYAQLLQDQQQGQYVEQVEKLFVAYLSVPVKEVRERLLRRLFQRVRIVQAFQDQSKYKVNNNYLLAKFVYRKRVLNQLINGLLINQEVAQEVTKLEINVGTLITKILTIAFSDSSVAQTQKSQNLTTYLLTFQSLMHKHPELLGLIDLVEEGASHNCRYLRLIRDLFSKDANKRKFSSQILSKQFSSDSTQVEINDLLHMTTASFNQDTLHESSWHEMASELDAGVNLQSDFTNFDTINIVSILMSAKSDYSLRRSSLEQLTMLLFDQAARRGRALFNNQVAGITDVFSFVVQELLQGYNTCKNVLGSSTNELPADQIHYLADCLKFMVFAHLFYGEEQVVKSLFDQLKIFQTSQQSSQLQQFENLLNACVFFCGSQLMRKQALRLLFLIVFNPVLLKTKVKQLPGGKKTVQMLMPDFCEGAFCLVVPNSIQVIRQPMRDDFLLTAEQKDCVNSMLQSTQRETLNQEHIGQVSKMFVDASLDDYHRVMQTFEQLQNYLLAISVANEQLLSHQMMSKLQELFRMLPTKDFEFNFLADLCMFTNQILKCAENIQNGKQVEAFVHAVCQGLKFHMLPYLFEVGISGLEEEMHVQHSPRMHFLGQFLELIYNLGNTDCMIHRDHRAPSNFQVAVLSTSLVNYLADLFIVMKDQLVHRHKILQVVAMMINKFQTRQLQMDRVPTLLISTIQQYKLTGSFQSNSLVMTSIRLLIQIYQQRLSHIELPSNSDLDQQTMLSRTAGRVMREFESSGWITRFTESRDARLRCLAWDVLTEIFDYSFFIQNQTLVHQSLQTLQRPSELYCVKIAVLRFVNKLCSNLIQNVDIGMLNGANQGDDCEGQTQESATVKLLIGQISKQGFISQIHNILIQKDCPLLMISQLLRFLSQLIQLDFKRTLPILTQLDYWTVLVDLVNIEGLARQDLRETRNILIHTSKNLLNTQGQKPDVIYMSLNSVLDFIFEAMKKDSQLANLLVKTTKLMPSIFQVLNQTLDQVSSLQHNQGLKNMQGLVLINIDKCVKLMHLALLHPRDHTLNLLHNLIEQPYPAAAQVEEVPDQDKHGGWKMILKMFDLVGSKHSLYYYGHIDVKLAICRFIAEYLLRASQAKLQITLDHTIKKFDASVHLQSIQENQQQEQDLSTFGGQLLLEFGKVFRALYVDKRDSRQQQGVPHEMADHENSKIDICQCLSILCGISQAAKVQAVTQNLMKKAIEICEENVTALNLIELQKLANKGSQRNPLGASTMQQTRTQIDLNTRKFKYSEMGDAEACEREVCRMLSLINHIMYNSGSLLLEFLFNTSSTTGAAEGAQMSFVSQNAMNKSTALRKKSKEASLGDSMISLFGQTMEQIQIGSVVEECLNCMVTVASQAKKYKNAYLAQCASLQGSKRNTLIKIVSAELQKENIQGNTKKMHLLFAFLKSVSLSAEVVREISKLRIIEEIQTQLQPACKNEKDIKVLKSFLLHYAGFLAGYAHSEEGVKTVIQIKQVFTMCLFVIDTVTPPSGPEVTPLTQLVINLLLFLRNASSNRVGKQHFISDSAFLPCLMAFLASRQQHARVRASTAACLWTVLFNHQGVKAALNSEQARSELQLLQNEYQRTTDISKYASYVTENAERGFDPCAFDVVDDSAEKEQSAIRKMDHFILIALNGILTLLDA